MCVRFCVKLHLEYLVFLSPPNVDIPYPDTVSVCVCVNLFNLFLTWNQVFFFSQLLYGLIT